MTIPRPLNPAGPLAWSDAFLLGYGPMDAVHHEFVTAVAALQQASDAELPACLDAFAAHAKSHFETENQWMVENDFPARDCHIDEHAAVMQSVQQVQERLAQGDHATCRRLAEELARWFPEHAGHQDAALAHLMCKERLGGKPVVIRRDIGTRKTAP